MDSSNYYSSADDEGGNKNGSRRYKSDKPRTYKYEEKKSKEEIFNEIKKQIGYLAKDLEEFEKRAKDLEREIDKISQEDHSYVAILRKVGDTCEKPSNLEEIIVQSNYEKRGEIFTRADKCERAIKYQKTDEQSRIRRGLQTLHQYIGALTRFGLDGPERDKKGEMRTKVNTLQMRLDDATGMIKDSGKVAQRCRENFQLTWYQRANIKEVTNGVDGREQFLISTCVSHLEGFCHSISRKAEKIQKRFGELRELLQKFQESVMPFSGREDNENALPVLSDTVSGIFVGNSYKQDILKSGEEYKKNHHKYNDFDDFDEIHHTRFKFVNFLVTHYYSHKVKFSHRESKSTQDAKKALEAIEEIHNIPQASSKIPRGTLAKIAEYETKLSNINVEKKFANLREQYKEIFTTENDALVEELRNAYGLPVPSFPELSSAPTSSSASDKRRLTSEKDKILVPPKKIYKTASGKSRLNLE